MAGIRAEVRIDSPPHCVVASAAEAGSESRSVSWTCDEEGTVTEEFLLEAPDGSTPSALEEVDTEFEEVFRYESTGAYRFERSSDVECVCEFIEEFDSPVREVFARDGVLVVAFHVSDIETLQGILSGLNERWSNLGIDRLVRSGEDRDGENLVLVDRGTLTDRQREVLATAHEMGYFDHPKRANAGEVADALDINPTTFTEHLSAAQRKLLGAVLEA